MNSRSEDQAIAPAQTESDAILAECHQLLEKIARRLAIPQVVAGCTNSVDESEIITCSKKENC